MELCYKCKYRGDIPGDCHSCCKYPGNDLGLFNIFSRGNLKNAQKLNIRAEKAGIQGGWFYWPINFDPVWLLNCDGFSLKEGKDAK